MGNLKPLAEDLTKDYKNQIVNNIDCKYLGMDNTIEITLSFISGDTLAIRVFEEGGAYLEGIVNGILKCSIFHDEPIENIDDKYLN